MKRQIYNDTPSLTPGLWNEIIHIVGETEPQLFEIFNRHMELHEVVIC